MPYYSRNDSLIIFKFVLGNMYQYIYHYILNVILFVSVYPFLKIDAEKNLKI